MKKFKYLIIVFIILVLLVITILLIANRKEEVVEQQPEQEEIVEEGYINIKDPKKMFNIVNCISRYYDIINQNSSLYYTTDESGNRIKNITNQAKEAVYHLLSTDYIKENDITTENVIDKIVTINEKALFVPTKMKVDSNNNIERYLVSGFITGLKNNYIGDINIIVNLDNQNEAFSIEPINKQINSIEDLEKEVQITQIEQNDNNKYIPIEVNDEYIITQYINMYKKMALAKPEIAFEYLDKEYREKRFGTQEEYLKYVQANKDYITTLALQKYKVDQNKYLCNDIYENMYTFTTNDGLLDYTIKLDNYTTPSQDVIDKYNNSEDLNKISMNVDRVIKMMNSRDYRTMYSILNEEYKKNNYASQDDFEKYMRDTYKQYYEYSIEDSYKEGDVYIITVKLTDITEKEPFKMDFRLIMKLQQDMEFRISFPHVVME